MHRPGTALAAFLIGFAFASSASADTFCVAPATGCTHTATSLQNALSSAGSLPGDDAISLGAATYTEDNLVYSPGDHARVLIQGAGAASTVIQPASATAVGTTLRATTGPMDISGVHVLAGAAPGTLAVALSAGGLITYTDISAAPGATDPSGINVVAGTLANAAAIGAVNVALPGNGTCVTGSGTGTLMVNDSTLSDCANGVEGYATGTVAARLHLLNVINGVHVVGNGQLATFDDSLFIGRNGGTAAKVEQSISGSGTNTLELHHDTLIGSGTGIGAHVSNAVNSSDTELLVYDSIIRNFGTPMKCESNGSDPADLQADFVNYTGSPSDTCTGVVTLANPSTVDPQFTNQGDGDYHLRPTSPLVDVDPTPLRSDETDRDLDFTVRIINGKRDVGAFERPLMPTATAGGSYGVTDTSALVQVTANGGGARTQAKLLYGPTSAYGSELELEMTEPSFTDRRYDVALTGLAPGTRYHYALVATNSSGTASSADATFTTTSPPPPPPPLAKAALSALRISPARFRAAAHGATFAKTGIGATVTYTMSAAGTVKLRVYRAAKGIRVGGRCVAKSRKHRTGKACKRYVAVGKAISRASAAGVNRMRFSGRVGGRKLKPGAYRLQSLDPSGASRRARFSIVRR